MKPQEIFNRIANHLLNQGCKSISKGSCLYHNSDGTKCAVGVFIPDNVYKEEMEGEAVYDIIKMSSRLKYLKPHVALLENLQAIHDENCVKEWSEELKDLANCNSLNHIVVNRWEKEKTS